MWGETPQFNFLNDNLCQLRKVEEGRELVIPGFACPIDGWGIDWVPFLEAVDEGLDFGAVGLGGFAGVRFPGELVVALIRESALNHFDEGFESHLIALAKVEHTLCGFFRRRRVVKHGPAPVKD